MTTVPFERATLLSRSSSAGSSTTPTTTWSPIGVIPRPLRTQAVGPGRSLQPASGYVPDPPGWRLGLCVPGRASG